MVRLREITESDLQWMALYGNNENLSRNLRDAFPFPYTMDHAVGFLNLVNEMNPKTIFAIEFEGKYVGNMGLYPGSDVYRKSAELGYFIGEPFWNKGIVSRAIPLMLEFGFTNLDIVRIHAGVFSFNTASQRVLEKCGFTLEGIFAKSVIKNDILYDEYRYAILK